MSFVHRLKLMTPAPGPKRSSAHKCTRAQGDQRPIKIVWTPVQSASQHAPLCRTPLPSTKITRPAQVIKSWSAAARRRSTGAWTQFEPHKQVCRGPLARPRATTCWGNHNRNSASNKTLRRMNLSEQDRRTHYTDEGVCQKWSCVRAANSNGHNNVAQLCRHPGHAVAPMEVARAHCGAQQVMESIDIASYLLFNMIEATKQRNGTPGAPGCVPNITDKK